ncbi:helix-turn-helix domain-containing protein [Clostridioides mangenotii]|nr:helix-turn-helix domain-containing protein [Clostridioides mangenotii]
MQIIIKNNNQEPQVNKVEVTKEIIKEETLLTAKIENVLFTVEELKQILKVSKGDVYSLINKGELKALKLGRLKVPYFEVERFLRDNLGRDFDFKN